MRLQREKLGDRKSEITILIDNDKITRLYPNINNQLRYQRKRQQNTAGQGGSQSNTGGTLPQPMDSFSFGGGSNNYQTEKKEVDEIFMFLNKIQGGDSRKDENE